ncbi:MAG: recombination-associated protein RdgC [Pseudomonadaceae bacterium]|nr:recombination-associated protein RdgC [Pseudomonadaceae bacterium]
MKSFRFYQLMSEWAMSEAALDEFLQNQPFKPCSAFSMESWGFVPILADGLLCRRLSGADFMKIRVQRRVMPAAAVAEALGERIEAFNSRMGRLPSRKEKRELKEEVVAELMPKALTASTYLGAFYIHKRKVLVIGATPNKTAERMLDSIRAGLGVLQVYELEGKNKTEKFLRRLLMEAGPFDLGRECVLTDSDSAVLSFRGIDLQSETLSMHLNDGYDVDRIGLNAHEFAFTLDKDLIVRKFKMVIDPDEIIEVDGEEDVIANLDSELVQLKNHIDALLGILEAELGGFAQ